MLKDIINIEGAEGGGQILRTSLSLSAITKQAFGIRNIRAKRKKSGLLRQHLTAVRAAAKICNAKVEGDAMLSSELSFQPGAIAGGDYRFCIGTAGSTSLLAQTLIPVLLHAKEKSTLILEGGTHNPFAPSFDFIQSVYLPILKKMGVNVEGKLLKHGFYPAGGGKVTFHIDPLEAPLRSVQFYDRGALTGARADVWIANLDRSIAEREANVIRRRMNWTEDQIKIQRLSDVHGPGNVVSIVLTFKYITVMFVTYGRLGVSAEKVADEACRQATEFLNSDAEVPSRLADQLLLPMALATNDGVSTVDLGSHFRSNAKVIEKFVSWNSYVAEEKGNKVFFKYDALKIDDAYFERFEKS